MKKLPLILTGIIVIGLLPGCQKQRYPKRNTLKWLQVETEKIQNNKFINHKYLSDKERIDAVSNLYHREKWPLAVAYEDTKRAERKLKHTLKSSKRIGQRAEKKQNHDLALEAKFLQNDTIEMLDNTQKMMQVIQKDPAYKKQSRAFYRTKFLKRVGYVAAAPPFAVGLLITTIFFSILIGHPIIHVH